MPYANTWTNEKKKLGLRNDNMTMRAMYNTIKGSVNYARFTDKMKKVVAQSNVQTVKAQVLKKLNKPGVINAMKGYLGKNFNIVSQNQRNKENAYIQETQNIVNEYNATNKSNASQMSALVNKYKRDLNNLDMYWPGMSQRDRKVALDSLVSYRKRSARFLLNRR